MGIRCKTRKLVSNTLSSEGPDPGLCSIEQYLAKKDRFQVAPTNKIPVSWPHDDKTRPLSDRYGVFDNALDIVKILTQRGFPAAEERTVIVLTLWPEKDTARWQEAVDCINEIIKDAAARASTTMGVELESPSQRYYDISSAISPGTSVHKFFLQIEPVVEAEVKKLCSGLWTSIAYHNRYNKFSGNVGYDELIQIEFVEQPTVIIFVAPGSLAH
ncbi:hypothetical protein VE02_04403 [Pseudogymnoascus sp. 03VT05]|nr:hypothetical protein VE02_04403 [Pseudogymnoascus sp. 03VT05]